MRLTTEVPPQSIVQGMKVWFSYTGGGGVSPFSEGIVVLRRGNKIVVFTPNHCRAADGRQDAFSDYNRHTFSWRASRGLWQEADDHSKNPMSASLWFPCEQLAAATSPVGWVGKHEDGSWDQGTASPEVVIERWDLRSPGWRLKVFGR